MRVLNVITVEDSDGEDDGEANSATKEKEEVVGQLAAMSPLCHCEQKRESLLLLSCAWPDVLGRVVAVAFV